MKAAINHLDTMLRQAQVNLDTALANVATHKGHVEEHQRKADLLRAEVDEIGAALRKLKS